MLVSTGGDLTALFSFLIFRLWANTNIIFVHNSFENPLDHQVEPEDVHHEKENKESCQHSSEVKVECFLVEGDNLFKNSSKYMEREVHS